MHITSSSSIISTGVGELSTTANNWASFTTVSITDLANLKATPTNKATVTTRIFYVIVETEGVSKNIIGPYTLKIGCLSEYIDYTAAGFLAGGVSRVTKEVGISGTQIASFPLLPTMTYTWCRITDVRVYYSMVSPINPTAFTTE